MRLPQKNAVDCLTKANKSMGLPVCVGVRWYKRRLADKVRG